MEYGKKVLLFTLLMLFAVPPALMAQDSFKKAILTHKLNGKMKKLKWNRVVTLNLKEPVDESLSYSGKLISMNQKSIKIAVAGKGKRFDLDNVQRIQFDGNPTDRYWLLLFITLVLVAASAFFLGPGGSTTGSCLSVVLAIGGVVLSVLSSTNIPREQEEVLNPSTDWHIEIVEQV